MKTLLIADDHEQIVDVLKEYALKNNYAVHTAKTGIQALEKFDACHFDAVLLDVMMPEMDGMEVCRQIRKKSMVPIIMITARSEDFERIMGLDIGADDYVVSLFLHRKSWRALGRSCAESTRTKHPAMSFPKAAFVSVWTNTRPR